RAKYAVRVAWILRAARRAHAPPDIRRRAVAGGRDRAEVAGRALDAAGAELVRAMARIGITRRPHSVKTSTALQTVAFMRLDARQHRRLTLRNAASPDGRDAAAAEIH